MHNTVTKHRTGYLYRRGSSGVFYLEYMMGGKRIKKALHNADGAPITNRRDAETARAKIMSPLTVANPSDLPKPVQAPLPIVAAAPIVAPVRLPDKGFLEISDMWSSYLASQRRPDSGPRTLKDYEHHACLFVEWLKANYPKCTHLNQITVQIAEQYASYLLNPGAYPKTLRSKKRKPEQEDTKEKPTPKHALSSNTFNKHIRLLELVFRVLQAKAGMTSNPWSTIMRKREDKKNRRELTVEEINSIVNKANGELKTLLLIGIYTGMRLGDACTLRWSETDLIRRIILRIPNKTARRKNQPVHIPIHPTLMDYLSEIPKNKQKGYVLPHTAAMYQRNASDVSKRLRTHFKTCGLQVHAEGTGEGTKTRAVVEVGFHSLRHSFVSLCRAADTPLAVVEAIVGHSNPAMTRHYTHIGDLAASQAVAALPALGVEIKDNGKKAEEAKHDVRVELSERDRKIVSILEYSSSKTWLADRDQILTMIQNK